MKKNEIKILKILAEIQNPDKRVEGVARELFKLGEDRAINMVSAEKTALTGNDVKKYIDEYMKYVYVQIDKILKKEYGDINGSASKINERTLDGAADKPIRGLYDANPGDIIKIGIEGTRDKVLTKIDKVVSKDRLQDKDGNIFGRDGRIYRRKGYQLQGTKGKIISAQHVTQKELDDQHDKDRRRFLKNNDWDRVSDDRIEHILKILRVGMGTIQKRINYYEK